MQAAKTFRIDLPSVKNRIKKFYRPTCLTNHKLEQVFLDSGRRQKLHKQIRSWQFILRPGHKRSTRDTHSTHNRSHTTACPRTPHTFFSILGSQFSKKKEKKREIDAVLWCSTLYTFGVDKKQNILRAGACTRCMTTMSVFSHTCGTCHKGRCRLFPGEVLQTITKCRKNDPGSEPSDAFKHFLVT